MINKSILAIVLVLFSFAFSSTLVFAYGEDTFKARIVNMESGKCKNFDSESYAESDDDCVKLTLRPTSEDVEVETFEILQNVTSDQVFESQGYRESDYVFVQSMEAGEEGSEEVEYSIVELNRSAGLIPLVILFLILVIVVGRVRGATSLVALGISIASIFGLLVPLVLHGEDPLLFGGLIAIGILFVSIYLSHGFNRKSTLALLGIAGSIVLTVFIALIFSSLVRITGFGSEEAFFLSQSSGVKIDMAKVFIASMILGTVGILDDVAVSQVNFIKGLKEQNPELGAKELFKKSLALGRDHIASMINTLFLVYAGASLPLVLLFQLNGVEFGQIIHYEQFAEEIVRTIVGSIGLILAVPITAFIASESYAKKADKD